MALHIIILAAGNGRRMKSSLPKVLHTLMGKSMLARVIESAQALSPEAIHVVYGQNGDKVRAALADYDVNWVYQEQPLGTGHAVLQAMQHIPPHGQCLVLSADVPLIDTETLQSMVQKANQHEGLGLLVAKVDNPHGLGRVLRDKQGSVVQIVEEKDASAAQKKIHEIYSGIMLSSNHLLHEFLPQLDANNAQEEYYLTQIIAIAVKGQYSIYTEHPKHAMEVYGVNNRMQLAEAERHLQKKTAHDLMEEGVGIVDPCRFDLRGTLNCYADVSIDINCVFEGEVSIGNNTYIGPNCYIKDAKIGDNVRIEANSHINGAKIGDRSQIGPFARVRPNSELGTDTKVGNFVETKNIRLDNGSKASHLSYLGDAEIGKAVNIGAGTITCNYDGFSKHTTIIEDGAFIGSDTQLVAPVTVGKNATIGAGATIRRNVASNQLALNDCKQKAIDDWQRQRKE